MFGRMFASQNLNWNYVKKKKKELCGKVDLRFSELNKTQRVFLV